MDPSPCLSYNRNLLNKSITDPLLHCEASNYQAMHSNLITHECVRVYVRDTNDMSQHCGFRNPIYDLTLNVTVFTSFEMPSQGIATAHNIMVLLVVRCACVAGHTTAELCGEHNIDHATRLSTDSCGSTSSSQRRATLWR